jgi:hypothetical protein
VVWVLAIPTFGLSVVLAPLGGVLSVVAWRRSPHDALFWIGFALNAVSVLSLLGLVVSLITGDSGVSFE